MTNIIGFSFLGNECKRFLFLKFRDAFVQKVTPELQEIFNKGLEMEDKIIKDLREKGEKVENIDEKTLKQFYVSDDSSFWIGGFIDGFIEQNGEKMVLEIKTANKNNFANFKYFGVAKSKPIYHTQLNCYLGLTGLKKGIWFVYNKETGEIYQEILNFDEEKFQTDMKKAKSIVESTDVCEPKCDYMCKYCDAFNICKGNDLPEINCKTCRWFCITNAMKKPHCSKKGCDITDPKDVCSDFCYTDEMFHMAHFRFEDEDLFFSKERKRLEDCIILLRDDFGHEYPIRGLEDCKTLKSKMATGWNPKAKV